MKGRFSAVSTNFLVLFSVLKSSRRDLSVPHCKRGRKKFKRRKKSCLESDAARCAAAVRGEESAFGEIREYQLAFEREAIEAKQREQLARDAAVKKAAEAEAVAVEAKKREQVAREVRIEFND